MKAPSLGPQPQSVSDIDCGENNCVWTDINEVGNQIRHHWEVLNTGYYYDARSCDTPTGCSVYAAAITGIWENYACRPHNYVWFLGTNHAWTDLRRSGMNIADDSPGVTYWYSRSC